MQSSLVLLLFFVSCANCYKILGVFSLPSRSHYYYGHALMKGLADEGHEVTVVSPFLPKAPIKNYKPILLEHSWNEYKKDLLKGNFVDFNNQHFWGIIFDVYDFGRKQTEWALTSENYKNFLKSDAQFDVIVVEILNNDAFLGLGQHFNAPVIVTSPHGAFKWNTDSVAAPIFASYVPHTYNGYTDRMNFWQRMYNSLCFWYEDIVIPLHQVPQQQKLLEKMFPNAINMPTIEELKRNVSLVLLNTHVTLGTPRPYPPNMIEIGGLHVKRDVDPLPQNIQQFLDGATNGVVYLSLGSNVQFSKLTNERKAEILNAFNEHPNVRIVIKSEASVEIPSHKASDVLVQSWFAQDAILAHPNVKIFITHGGLLSTTESVYFGKPVIGISFAFDQELNMVIAEQKGYGISIPYQHFTTEKLRSALGKMLSNSSYSENAKLISDRFRDQLTPPLDTAIHWVKHVAKNKGASHLRMAAVDLPFYTLYNLDVWAFILIILLLIIFAVKKTTGALHCLLCTSPKTTKRKYD